MARVEETTVTLIDDFDGGPAAETLKFAVDNKTYEIDLSKSNAREFRQALRPYVEQARAAHRGGSSLRSKGSPRRNGSPRREGYDRIEVRAWAKANGIKVAPRGRIANDVVERWRRATSTK
jgi:nucleoid-associated protein Lsr2